MLLHRALLAAAYTPFTQALLGQFSSPGRLVGSSFGIPTLNATYDYIVIGGGLAGNVVAGRLTEKSNASVAIVEAGNFYELNNGNWSQIPYYSEQWAGSEQDDYNPLVDWGLETVPQVSGDIIHYAQGKNLGGSSGRNQMLYHRATKGYYQAWADHVGDNSYTWENMTTYLERSMTFTPPRPTAQNVNATTSYDASAFLPTSNSSNPLQVSYPSFVQELSAYGPDAFRSIGLEEQAGFSSGVLHGFGTWTSTIDPTTGTRSSSEASFLQEAFGREQLTVYVNTKAQNIIFDANKTAIAVNVTSSSSASDALYYTLSARKGILLAAGAYHSPQILMLSGIGPKATLNQFSIPIVSALEGVGQNMWDTTNIGGIVYNISTSITTFSDYETNATLFAEAEQQFLSAGTGPLTNIGEDFVGWYKIGDNVTSEFSNATQAWLASLPSDWPELELSLASSSRSLEVTNDETKVGSLNCLMVGTAGRGNMTIQSASIFDKPVIDPNWLRDPRDQEVAVAAFKLARKAWQGVPPGVIVGDEVFPGKNVTSDADLLEAIKGNIAAIHHASASCAMGKVGDPTAVVDSKGRVIGVQGLMVVDSSSLPFTNPGHTQGTTYGHAEKMAQIVLDSMF
ncbi:alcohol oxidase [Microthyrium microscopicum]|uniref:Alcohol oxidase n=1 Tax=Microthyrium microscopicum TaxID=703497 RepID=A0A6A6UJ19_9PEZI|nr:alcohol oxidase [Microthyrium microscopicum]